MPTTSFSVQQQVNAAPEIVFEQVSDLTQHPKWAANDLVIEPVNGDVPHVGGRYRSAADVGSLHFDAELVITEFVAPTRFGFKGEDKTGKFAHLFTLEAKNGGTLVTRKIDFDLSLKQYLMYLVLYFPVRLPAARKALARLAEQV